MQIVTHSFAPRDLVAGHVALDFLNTVTARDMPTPLDWLDGYARLIDWAALAGVVGAETAVMLRKLAAASPRRAAEALTRARRLREASYQIFTALIAGAAAPSDAMEHLEGAWKRATNRARLTRAGDRIVVSLDAEESGLELIADTLALNAIDLLLELPVGRARTCLGTHCGWLFIDTSKGGRRVWCDMATCGNAAKSRRHQAGLKGK